MAEIISDSFTGVGEGSPKRMKAGDFGVSGTFVGTVQLQRQIGGTWYVIAEHSAPTGVGSETTFENASIKQMRFVCTAYTSGTINCHAE